MMRNLPNAESILEVHLHLLDFGICVVWEYGGIHGKASRDWESRKPKTFQEPEN
jgi:hypothetical protein